MKKIFKECKKTIAVIMMACLLLNMSSISSNAQPGISLCGEAVEKDNEELE